MSLEAQAFRAAAERQRIAAELIQWDAGCSNRLRYQCDSFTAGESDCLMRATAQRSTAADLTFSTLVRQQAVDAAAEGFKGPL
jgi:hypothetical protein